jgi:RNA polymerase sigma-70 factor (ECF subfamily)
MRESDVESFRILYEANYERIAAYVLRRAASAEDAADVISEIFLTAWRRLETLPQGEQSTLWLYSTARRVLGNHRRSTERRRRLLDRIRQQPIDELGELTDTGMVADAFSRLRDDDQEVLGLIAWDGLTHRQLGAVLGCSENAAKLRVSRARKRFASEIARLDGQLPISDRVAVGTNSAPHRRSQ